jgi:hypothetical protein
VIRRLTAAPDLYLSLRLGLFDGLGLQLEACGLELSACASGWRQLPEPREDELAAAVAAREFGFRQHMPGGYLLKLLDFDRRTARPERCQIQ